MVWGGNGRYGGSKRSAPKILKLDSRAWQISCMDASPTLHVLTEDGDVYCSSFPPWSSFMSPLELVLGLSSLRVVWVSSGDSHAVAITQEGLAFGWGSPYFGFKNASREPVQIKGLNRITRASCGSRHTCFLDSSQRVYSAGKNNRGQLGRNISSSWEPGIVNFPSQNKVLQISCGSNHTLCLCERENDALNVFSWGDNRYGQCGVDTAKSQMIRVPTLVSSSLFQKMRVFNVFAGGNRSVAVAISPGSSSHAFKVNSGFNNFRSLLAMESRLSQRLLDSVEAVELGVTGATRKMLKLAERVFGSLKSLAVGYVTIKEENENFELTIDTNSMFEFLDRVARQKNVMSRLIKIIDRCVDTFQKCAQELKRKEQLRSVLCLLLVCGSLRSINISTQGLAVHDRVMSCLAMLPKIKGKPSASSMLARMAIEIVPVNHLSKRLIVPIVQAFDLYFRQPKTEHNVRRWMSVADFLNDMFFHNTQNKNRIIKADYVMRNGGLKEVVPVEVFVSRVASGIPDRALYEEYRRWLARRNDGVFSLMKYSFLLDASSKRRVLQLEARFGMMQQGRNAMFQSIFSRQTSPYFVMKVRRNAILRDTLNIINKVLADQMQQEMKKELKVIFANEEGVDQGGVKREFFQLLVEELFNPLYGMWIRNKRSGSYWFAAHNEVLSGADDLKNYFLTGIALGLCVYNGVLLDINFPNVLYKKLLTESVGLSDLRDLMPDVYDGLLELLKYEKDDLEDVFCLSFEVTLKDFDAVKTYELVKGGSDKEVTQENKCEYVDLICDFYLNKRVDAQFKAFARGFATLVDGKSLELFTSSELELLVAGEVELDFKALESSCQYEGGYSHGHPVIRRLWTVLHGLNLKDRAKFLKFVTGCPRAPIGGLGKLQPPLKIQKHGGRDEKMLPQAATCFSTLLLPEYSSIPKLREKLLLAIENCEGFGLK